MNREAVKTVEITLVLDAASLQKLSDKSPMASWVLGEKIAEQLQKGQALIHIDAPAMFSYFHV